MNRSPTKVNRSPTKVSKPSGKLKTPIASPAKQVNLEATNSSEETEDSTSTKLPEVVNGASLEPKGEDAPNLCGYVEVREIKDHFFVIVLVNSELLMKYFAIYWMWFPVWITTNDPVIVIFSLHFVLTTACSI